MAARTNTMQTIIIKVLYGTEMRRYTSSVDALKWKALCKRLSDLFELPPRFKVTYIDDENDQITVSTDEELIEAIQLALRTEPSVLRLTIIKGDASPPTNEGAKAKGVCGASQERAHDTTNDASNNASPRASVPDLKPFFEQLAKQLPAALGSLPESLRTMIPNAELDVDATIAANRNESVAHAAAGIACDAARVAATATAQAASGVAPPYMDAYVSPHPRGAKHGVHEGVTCDKSGVCPIVGNRYHMKGKNYDLCEAEFLKLSDQEKLPFVKIAPPGPNNPSSMNECPRPNNVSGCHPNVQCDRSGMCPIVGIRYKLRGHNYDLCQAEYDKLSDAEKLQYEAIPPPQRAPPCAGFGPWRHPWSCRGNGWGPRAERKGGDGGVASKPLMRFVRDVTIFDGTQMPPGTVFTKIWRIKNVGEVPFPPGTRMMFVGGDQMTNSLDVPLARAMPVQPGEEVDVAVEMTSPTELGRYIGYWRLVGPNGRRKFGQRVWCHVQVVDPTQAAIDSFDDLNSTLAEIEKKHELATENDQDADDAEHDETEPCTAVPGPAVPGAAVPSATSAVAATVMPTPVAMQPPAMSPPPITPRPSEKDADQEMEVDEATAVEPDFKCTGPADQPADQEEETTTENGSVPDDCVLVTEGMLVDGEADKGAEVAMESHTHKIDAVVSPTTNTIETLRAMGFTDKNMVAQVIEKHGDDVEACARDLAAASEWDSLLDDLAEMGFHNRELNKTLMLKNHGNIKRTVRDLIEA